jgi:hypothetical protein
MPSWRSLYGLGFVDSLVFDPLAFNRHRRRADVILEKRQNKSAVTMGCRRRYMVDVGIGATIEAVQPKLCTVIPT